MSLSVGYHLRENKNKNKWDIVRHHLGFVKYEVLFEKFKSKTSIEENLKCLLKLVNSIINVESLTRKHWYEESQT